MLSLARGHVLLLVLAALAGGCASPEPTTAVTSQRDSFVLGDWVPSPKVRWQYNIGSPGPDLNVDADVYVVDGDETTPEQVRRLHDAGKFAVCYVNAGAWEDWRADARAFPRSVRGADMDGWRGEQWLDVRAVSVLSPIMAARTASCARKGFDGIDFDNVDGYVNETGFPLASDDQLAYNRHLAELAHSFGLAVGLKNDVDQIVALEPYFDFAVNESCGEYDECAKYAPFVAAGKSVLRIEYGTSPTDCGKRYDGVSTIVKKKELGGWLIRCP